MNFIEWVTINIPETFIFLVFLRYSLKQKFNILLPLIFIVVVLSMLRTFYNNEYIVAAACFLSYGLFVFRKKYAVKAIRSLLFLIIFTIVIDSSWMLFIYAVSGKTIAYIQSNYFLFLVCVYYAAISKALLLYAYHKQRRIKA